MEKLQLNDARWYFTEAQQFWIGLLGFCRNVVT
jgi:hypothetical protein